MLLAIDIGNTHTVAAVFDGASLEAEWRIVTSEHPSQSSLEAVFDAHLRKHDILPEVIKAIGISSVVPSLTEEYLRMARAIFRVEAFAIDGSTDIGIAIRYDDPMAVGADRLCNAVAGFAKYGGPLIIVDFGTATTYDLVAKNGDYLGGVIAPGVETSAADLHRRAARLPRIDLMLPSSIIAKDTVSSMQAGILYGAIDATEGMVRRLSEALQTSEGAPPTVIGTGGFSPFISEHSSALQHLEPYLVLDGIRLIYDKIAASR